MPNPLQLALRLKAARWVAGAANEGGKPGSLPVTKLAERAALVENGITANRLQEIEQMKVPANRMRMLEFDAIADGLGVDRQWFRAEDLLPLLSELPDPAEALERELQEAADIADRRDDGSEEDERGRGREGRGR